MQAIKTRNRAWGRGIATLATASVLVGGIAWDAVATTIHESFDYAEGSLEGQNGGSGWAGPWALFDGGGSGEVISPGFTDPRVPGGASGNRLLVDDSVGGGVTRDFNDSLAIDGTTYWMSFIAQTSSTSSWASLALRNSNEEDQLLISKEFNGGQWRMQADGSFVAEGTDVTSQTFLLVRLDTNDLLGAATAHLWADPNLSEGQPQSGSANVSTDIFEWNGDISTVLIRSSNAVDLEIDEFRFADNFDAVAVPEPGSLALLGAGAGLMLIRRRR